MIFPFCFYCTFFCLFVLFLCGWLNIILVCWIFVFIFVFFFGCFVFTNKRRKKKKKKRDIWMYCDLIAQIIINFCCLSVWITVKINLLVSMSFRFCFIVFLLFVFFLFFLFCGWNFGWICLNNMNNYIIRVGILNQFETCIICTMTNVLDSAPIWNCLLNNYLNQCI